MEKSRKKTKPATRTKAVKKPAKAVVRRRPKAASPAASRRKSKSEIDAWTIGMIAAVFAVAIGLWHFQKPADVSTPISPPAVSEMQKPVSEAANPAQPIAAVIQAPAPAPASSVEKPTARGPFAKFEGGTIYDHFQKLKGADRASRIEFWSNALWKVKQPKLFLSALGSGPQIADNHPYFPERYDCTTFVETIAALSQSNGAEEFFKHLLAIRYKDSKATFMTRNHFPEVDWIPNNEKAGIVHDITSEVAGSVGLQAKVEKKTIDRQKWLAEQIKEGRASRSLASLNDASWQGAVNAQVTYIEMGDLKKVLKKIPSGSILNLVRRNNDRHPVLITHQGFVIQQGGMTLLRHASSAGLVRTVVLQDYLKGLMSKPAYEHWPLVGVNLNQVK